MKETIPGRPAKSKVSRAVTTEPPHVENVVATCALGEEIDLNWLACILPDAEYDPEHFHALVFRDTKNRGSLLVNGSGIVVAVGFKSEASLDGSLRALVDTLRKHGRRVSKGATEIQNLVVSKDLARVLDLSRIPSTWPGAEYEPEQFPGVILRFERSRVTVLVFGSGKVVCVGARTMADAERAIAEVVRTL